MGLLSEEVVVIRHGRNKEDPVEITVNCPDQVGLGCDLSRLIFEFGLDVVRGDISTDCKWCYVIFWVVPNVASSRPIDWAMLKKRLVASCPPSSLMFYYVLNPEPKPKQLYVLRIGSVDRTGLLNDFSQALWELELTIHKVKVWTMPDGNSMHLFYVTDNRELLHTEKRQDDTCNYLKKILGESSTYFELRLTSPEFGGLECTTTSLPPSIRENMFNHNLPDFERDLKSGEGDGKLNSVSVSVDNFLSPAHTLLQIVCKSQKGIIYDVMRTLKDSNIQVSYGRLSRNTKGICEMDLFILQADGRKILDPDKQNALCTRLEMEITNPLRVMVANRGPDTELLVATPIELSGRGDEDDEDVALESEGEEGELMEFHYNHGSSLSQSSDYYPQDLDEGDGVDLYEGDGCDMGVTLELGDEGDLGDGCGVGTILDLVDFGDEVDEGDVGTSLNGVGDGMGRGLGLELLGDEGDVLGLNVDEDDEGDIRATLDDLGLGIEGYGGDLGVILDEIVLELGDGGDDIGSKDELFDGLGDVRLSRINYVGLDMDDEDEKDG
ncbi:hypothetical protein KI387_006354 [Taxus chinensis]|uniref:ACT domain-containing protein n=1 Tax=Taxus chinensis TaxID=29808 RepID=A0AA38GNT4_TAXCH|nr:hypothetical protein KI387_006354 [Taxus chinensis]